MPLLEHSLMHVLFWQPTPFHPGAHLQVPSLLQLPWPLQSKAQRLRPQSSPVKPGSHRQVPLRSPSPCAEQLFGHPPVTTEQSLPE